MCIFFPALFYKKKYDPFSLIKKVKPACDRICDKYRRLGGEEHHSLLLLLETIAIHQRNQKCSVRTEVCRPYPSPCLLSLHV